MDFRKIEPLLFRIPVGLGSRFRVFLYRLLGMKTGHRNRFEAGRVRRAHQVQIGSNNAFSKGFQLWPLDRAYAGTRIRIGNKNYFNRNLMLDACGYIEIGNENMFGPDVYITDSNHSVSMGVPPAAQPMQAGKVIIGNGCWIGAKAVILKDVELGDYCVVAAGAVVTKSFPSGSVIGGVPARLIKTISAS
ncbi:MAG: acyltransferase [Chitinophagaceae bacterium]